MLDFSGMSLASVDPSPTIDQTSDGGSGTDYSAIVNSVGQWGTELAAVLTAPQPNYSPAYPAGGGPYPYGSRDFPGGAGVGVSRMSASTKQLLIIGVIAVAMVGAIHFMH